MMIRDLEKIKQFRTEKMKQNISSSLETRTNDYFIVKKHSEIEEKISTLLFPFFKTKKIEKNYNNNNICCFFSKKDITKFSPDKINSNEFWTYMLDNFPMASITPNYVSNIEDANYANLQLAHKLNALGYLHDFIKENNSRTKVLEIGGGYGNLYYYLSDNDILNVDKYYYHVDLVKKFKHKNFFKTNGYGIPKELLNKNVTFDIIYSVNVFQYLSYRQKIAYYYSIYEKLNKNGVFIVSLFLETEKNKNAPYWGYKDLCGNNYFKFFNQFTPVDKEQNFFNDLHEIGFNSMQVIGNFNNYYLLYLRK